MSPSTLDAKDLRPRYRLTRGLFLRLLSAVSFIAFVSYGVQFEGLIGSDGLLPVGDYLERVDGFIVSERASGEAIGRWRFPTLAWLSDSDAAMESMILGGALCSVLCFAGVAPGPLLLLMWSLYLSLVVAGQTFLGFQWDSLLLEALFFSWFIAPWSWRPGLESRKSDPWPIGIFLIRFLLFKLMFLSGAVKLLSMDDAWWQLSALDVHYYTQPIPTWTSWYAHQLPAWFQKLSVTLMFIVELGVPFFIFGPRRLRLLAFGALVGLQLLIAATGNYGYFNLLTVVLCVPVLDDRALAGLPGLRRFRVEPSVEETEPKKRHPIKGLRVAIAVLLIGISSLVLVRELARTVPPGQSGLGGLTKWARIRALDPIDSFRSINGYGLFRSMTLERPEIVIEGSVDGEHWLEYEFRFKPGAVNRRPPMIGPHMPRLDWQMWFAALNPRGSSGWLMSLARALLENNEDVTRLLARESPFLDSPPRYLRLRLYDYRFTSPAEKRLSGNWWHREDLGLLTPDRLTLEDL